MSLTHTFSLFSLLSLSLSLTHTHRSCLLSYGCQGPHHYHDLSVFYRIHSYQAKASMASPCRASLLSLSLSLSLWPTISKSKPRLIMQLYYLLSPIYGHCVGGGWTRQLHTQSAYRFCRLHQSIVHELHCAAQRSSGILLALYHLLSCPSCAQHCSISDSCVVCVCYVTTSFVALALMLEWEDVEKEEPYLSFRLRRASWPPANRWARSAAYLFSRAMLQAMLARRKRTWKLHLAVPTMSGEDLFEWREAEAGQLTCYILRNGFVTSPKSVACLAPYLALEPIVLTPAETNEWMYECGSSWNTTYCLARGGADICVPWDLCVIDWDESWSVYCWRRSLLSCLQAIPWAWLSLGESQILNSQFQSISYLFLVSEFLSPSSPQ